MNPLLYGIDVSSHQGHVDWPAVRAAGKSFAIVKATEGATWTNPLFAEQWQGARDAGLSVSCYHFFKPTSSTPEEQTSHFLAVYRSVEGFADLPVAVDVEEIGRGQSSADLVRRVLAFVAILEDELGDLPMVYTYTNFALAHFAGSEAIELARLPLWIACYRERPEVPPPWSSAGKTWAIWQSTGTGECPGVRGKVDLNAMRAQVLGLAVEAESM